MTATFATTSRTPADRIYHVGMPALDDGSRDRASALLQRHYVAGRLSDDELSDRVGLVLGARSRRELVWAFRGLLDRRAVEEALAPSVRKVKRAGVLVALTTVWALASLLLFAVFAVAVAFHGADATTLAGFPLLWATLTLALWLLWRRGRNL